MHGNLNQFYQISINMLNVQPEGKELWTTYTPHTEMHTMSRPGRRERFMSLFWFGQGVIWVGSLCSMFYDFVFLCVWPCVVLNQKQLSIVVSD